MYNVEFYSSDEQALQTTSQILECKSFSKRLYHSPSDRHSYSAKFFPNPVSQGRLPGPVKDLFKYIRKFGYDLFYSPTGYIVLTHRYGRDGPESKKFDDKCLLFDFEFFQKINNSTFTDNYKKSLHKFSVLLENYRKSDFSNHSSISSVKAYPLCVFETTDPNIQITFSFEHFTSGELGLAQKSCNYEIRPTDIALLIKYVFHDASKNYEVCGTEQQKRQKISLDSKHQNVIDYSVLKLPANQFLEYLTLDSKNFISDCLSLNSSVLPPPSSSSSSDSPTSNNE